MTGFTLYRLTGMGWAKVHTFSNWKNAHVAKLRFEKKHPGAEFTIR